MSFGMPLKFFDSGSLQRMDRRVRDLGDPDLRDLMVLVASETEAQTRRRIQDDKQTPDGTDWDDWSKSYAGSQHGKNSSHEPHPGSLRSAGGHTLLQLGGDLMDSLQFEVENDKEALVGSNLVYARKVNEQRQYLGFSSENKGDIADIVKLFFEARLV